MQKMILTKFEDNMLVKEDVYFMSTYYKAGEGLKALVVCKDNKVHEVDPYALDLPIAEYNKVFAE